MSANVVAEELQNAVSPTKKVEEKEEVVTAEPVSPKKRKLEEDAADTEEDVESKKKRNEETAEEAVVEPETAAEEKPVEETDVSDEATQKAGVRAKFVDLIKGYFEKSVLADDVHPEAKANQIEELIFTAEGSDAKNETYLKTIWTVIYKVMIGGDFVTTIVGDIDEKFDFSADVSDEVQAKIDEQVKNELSEEPKEFDIESLKESAVEKTA